MSKIHIPTESELIYRIRNKDVKKDIKSLIRKKNTQINRLTKFIHQYNRVTASSICSFRKGTIGYSELSAIRKEAEELINFK